MQLREQDGTLYLRGLNDNQKALVQSFGCFKWDRQHFYWYGPASREALKRLSRAVRLPDGLMQRLKELETIQAAVDAERVKPDSEVKPLAEMPVRAKLYTHQVRAVNMCLMHFGLILNGAQNALRRQIEDARGASDDAKGDK